MATRVANPFTLDPFSTLVNLALLSLMPDGVKIGIQNNAIVYYTPSLLDTVVRTVQSWANKGCTRESLHHLWFPVRRAMDWYDAPLLTQAAKVGMDKLIDTYTNDRGGNVVHALQRARGLLDRDPAVTDSMGQAEDLATRPRLQELCHAWSEEERKAVSQLFALARAQPTQAHYRTSVMEILRGKAPELYRIIRTPAV